MGLRVTALVLLVLSGCGTNKGRLEGGLEYMDSRWDPGGEAAPVPRILVHAMQGTEDDRRAIVASYQNLLSLKDPVADDPSFVNLVLASHAPEGQVLDAVEVDARGRFSFGTVDAGTYLVFTEYTSDQGHFAWIERVTVQGTRTATVELTYRNRLPLERLRPLDRKSTTPPPAEVLDDPDKLERWIMEHSP